MKTQRGSVLIRSIHLRIKLQFYVSCMQEVIDHETWVMDLDAANAGKEEPNYFKLYSARKAYAMNSLRPKEWDSLINKMVEKPKLFDLFFR